MQGQANVFASTSLEAKHEPVRALHKTRRAQRVERSSLREERLPRDARGNVEVKLRIARCIEHERRRRAEHRAEHPRRAKQRARTARATERERAQGTGRTAQDLDRQVGSRGRAVGAEMQT